LLRSRNAHSPTHSVVEHQWLQCECGQRRCLCEVFGQAERGGHASSRIDNKPDTNAFRRRSIVAPGVTHAHTHTHTHRERERERESEKEKVCVCVCVMHANDFLYVVWRGAASTTLVVERRCVSWLLECVTDDWPRAGTLDGGVSSIGGGGGGRASIDGGRKQGRLATTTDPDHARTSSRLISHETKSSLARTHAARHVDSSHFLRRTKLEL